MGLSLQSSIAVVTGAAGGIGGATADAFLEEGARVVAVDVAPLTRGEDPVYLPLRADLTEEASVLHVVERSLEKFARIDSLVHCAGIIHDAVLWKLDDAHWQRVLDVNLTSAFRLLRAVVPVMRAQGGGAIVLVSSINGLRGTFGQANYAASKAGVAALAKTAALETGAFGIRVNAVAPGMVRSHMTSSLPLDVMEEALRRSALGRLGEPADVAGAILFLCSPLARYVTGTVLRVDGGQMIG